MLRSIRSLLVTFVLALSAFFGASPAAAQTLPPSLEGELFNAQENRFPGGMLDQGDVDVAGSCTATPGETFTLTYSAEGEALGPYPGAFTETGTVTVSLTAGDSTFPAGGAAQGVVTSWTANFTIDSAIGQVSGTKTLAEVRSGGICARAENAFGFGFYDAEVADADLNYEATIRTVNGTFRDHGVATARVTSHCVGAARPTCDFESEAFREVFVLSRGVLPLDTTGKATGGGQIGDITSLAQVTFGFEVKRTEDPDRLQGRCLVNDPAEQTRVKCLTVTSYQQVGNTATWEGTAEVNGAREHYRITVQDNGEPNQGLDTFSIVTETYQAAGNVQHGNVQLHKQQLGL